MADSVDRVFVHALHTVKKLPRTGTSRPPPEDRLKLYGLYKQSMEGDVSGVMNRPEGMSEESVSERNKWDAWYSQKGLSKTEAKRRYITTLIDAMHRYAATTPDAKELVSELEFVWDQIKSNLPSPEPILSTNTTTARQSAAIDVFPSSEFNTIPPMSIHDEDDNRSADGEDEYQTMDEFDEHGLPKMLVLRAGAEGDTELEEDEDDDIDDNKNSQVEHRVPFTTNININNHRNISNRSRTPQAGGGNNDNDSRRSNQTPNSNGNNNNNNRKSLIIPNHSNTNSIHSQNNSNHNNHNMNNDNNSSNNSNNNNNNNNNRLPISVPANPTPKWKRRVEQALTKMTAEVAALREQLEIRRSAAAAARTRLALLQKWVVWAAYIVAKHVVIDAVLVLVVLAWMKRRRDRRAELVVKLLGGFLRETVFRRRRRLGGGGGGGASANSGIGIGSMVGGKGVDVVAY